MNSLYILIFLWIAVYAEDEACFSRCHRMQIRSLARMDLAEDSLKYLLDKQRPLGKLKDACWRIYDHFDCMHRCEPSSEHEKFVKYAKRQCKFVMNELDEPLHCVSRYHSFMEIRCSSFMKEAVRLRDKVGRDYTPDVETCRYLHLNALCLENAVAAHCPTAKEYFRRLNFRDYFLNFILPEDDHAFDDQDLDTCQVYDFVKKAFPDKITTNEPKAPSRTVVETVPTTRKEKEFLETSTQFTHLETSTFIEQELADLEERNRQRESEQNSTQKALSSETATIDRELSDLNDVIDSEKTRGIEDSDETVMFLTSTPHSTTTSVSATSSIKLATANDSIEIPPDIGAAVLERTTRTVMNHTSTTTISPAKVSSKDEKVNPSSTTSKTTRSIFDIFSSTVVTSTPDTMTTDLEDLDLDYLLQSSEEWTEESHHSSDSEKQEDSDILPVDHDELSKVGPTDSVVDSPAIFSSSLQPVEMQNDATEISISKTTRKKLFSSDEDFSVSPPNFPYSNYKLGLPTTGRRSDGSIYTTNFAFVTKPMAATTGNPDPSTVTVDADYDYTATSFEVMEGGETLVTEKDEEPHEATLSSPIDIDEQKENTVLPSKNKTLLEILQNKTLTEILETERNLEKIDREEREQAERERKNEERDSVKRTKEYGLDSESVSSTIRPSPSGNTPFLRTNRVFVKAIRPWNDPGSKEEKNHDDAAEIYERNRAQEIDPVLDLPDDYEYLAEGHLDDEEDEEKQESMLDRPIPELGANELDNSTKLILIYSLLVVFTFIVLVVLLICCICSRLRSHRSNKYVIAKDMN